MPLYPQNPVQAPESYSSLALHHVTVTNVPSTCPTVTPVIQITLNRPAKLNAFTDLMRYDLERVYRLVDIDPRIKAVVLTGAGKAFCAGADLEIGFPGVRDDNGKLQRPKDQRDADHRDGGGRATLAIHHCNKPTIVAIQGSAVGVGITLTLPATIRVAYAKAKIGFVFSRRGVVMEACSSFYLPRLIGFTKALHLATTGAVYRADHDLVCPLFSELCDTPEVTLARALEIAHDIARNTSTVSTKIMREMMYRCPGGVEETHLLDSRLINGLYGEMDNLEGVRSFLAKKQARFEGRMPQDAPAHYPWWAEVDVGDKPLEYEEVKAKL